MPNALNFPDWRLSGGPGPPGGGRVPPGLVWTQRHCLGRSPSSPLAYWNTGILEFCSPRIAAPSDSGMIRQAPPRVPPRPSANPRLAPLRFRDDPPSSVGNIAVSRCQLVQPNNENRYSCLGYIYSHMCNQYHVVPTFSVYRILPRVSYQFPIHRPNTPGPVYEIVSM